MRRRYIIGLSIVFGLFMVVISIVVTLYFSWYLAEKYEIENLSLAAKQVIMRANKSYEDAYVILKKLEKLNLTPCSEEHIAEMRKIIFASLNAAEVGYFENGLLQCTSWGKAIERVPIQPPDIISKKGVEMTLSVYPQVSKEHSVIGFRYKKYNILVDPARFTDVIVNPEIQVAIIMKDGRIVSEHNNPSKKILLEIVNGEKKDSNSLIYTLNKKNSLVVVLEPKNAVFQRWLQELKVLLPFSILMMLCFIGGIVWVSRRRLSPLGELKAAIAKREFIVYYQPLIELKSRKCIGAEALIRWHHIDGTWRRPDLFIALAEEHNLIQPITDQVINILVSDLKNVLSTDSNFHVSINIAAEDFRTGRVLNVVNSVLQGTNIKPDQIWLEATERGFMDIKAVKKTINKACEFGYPIIIDDFGTGYSSLSYLEGLALDALKIDKSFVKSLGTSSATSHVVEHIISMAKKLGIKLIAEGVETTEQSEYLLKREVEYAQGWFFAKAMPINDFLNYYELHR